MKRILILLFVFVLVLGGVEAKPKKEKKQKKQEPKESVVVEQHELSLEDSLNIALGYIQGMVLSSNLLTDQSPLTDRIEYQNGFRKTVLGLTQEDLNYINGIAFGADLRNPIPDIYGNPKFPFVNEWAIEEIEKALMNESKMISEQRQKELTEALRDSLIIVDEDLLRDMNRVFTQTIIARSFPHFFGEGSSANDTLLFLNGFRDIINADNTRALYLAGLRDGKRMYEMMERTPNPFQEVGYNMNKALFIDGIAMGIIKPEQAIFVDEQVTAFFETTMNRLKGEKEKTLLADQMAYLEQNAKKEGVITTKSGLQYEVLSNPNPNGPKPNADSQIVVHYRGSLIDGTEFDSSYSRNEPMTAPLNRMISGWVEGLQLMSVGSKYRFVIPYQLGYGQRGAGGVIPPYATLIFEIELIEIK